MQGWARREALARERAKENGEEIEFGKYYSGGAALYQKDGDEGDSMPILRED